MNNRNSLAHSSIAGTQERQVERRRRVRKLKKQKPPPETISACGITFPKDWRSRLNDLRSETP